MNVFKLSMIRNAARSRHLLFFFALVMPLSSMSSPHENNGQGKGKGHQQVHSGKDKQTQRNEKNNAKWHQDSNKQKHTLANFNVSFGYVRPLAIEYGLTGYKGLPPGIAKQIGRGKPLPPGIAKKVLPREFISQLPVYVGYEWQVSGRDLLLVAVGTAIIAEIIENVFE